MIDDNVLAQIKKAWNLAEVAESKDDFRGADLAQTEVDTLVTLLVKRYYGAMPIKNTYGDLIMPNAIKTTLEAFMPGAVYLGIA